MKLSLGLLSTFLLVFITTITSNQFKPPKLADSVAIKTQNLGTKLKLFCQAEEGSRPLQFTWQKNGQQFSSSRNKYNIYSTEEDSLLVIDQLVIEDSGNYTCSVGNSAGTVHQTTVVIVKGF